MFNRDFVGHADKPYDFFMSRYSEAYKAETLAFIECLVEDKPSPCTGRDGIVALVMAMAAGKSAVEERWVDTPTSLPPHYSSPKIPLTTPPPLPLPYPYRTPALPPTPRWVDFGEILREEKVIDVSSMLN